MGGIFAQPIQSGQIVTVKFKYGVVDTGPGQAGVHGHHSPATKAQQQMFRKELKKDEWIFLFAKKLDKRAKVHLKSLDVTSNSVTAKVYYEDIGQVRTFASDAIDNVWKSMHATDGISAGQNKIFSMKNGRNARSVSVS